jgi:hypothetical protein
MPDAARLVTPELLDELPPDDPRARRSRRDLRRIHRAMGTVGVLQGAVAGLGLARPPRRILELGAGDGSLMLNLARRMQPSWRRVELTLLDRVDVVDDATHRAYLALGWSVDIEAIDVRDWAAATARPRYDLCVTSLFLHHFDAAGLARLLDAVALRSDAFVACEPRRARLARLGSRLVALLGANTVTREDAVRSVEAGFAGREMSTAWSEARARRPDGDAWAIEERAAGLFSQVFTAQRRPAVVPGSPDGP